jgi:hypothetical protein
MVMEYTNVEHCNMLLNLGTSTNRAGTAAREYRLLYPSRRHQASIVFRRLEQSVRKIGSVPRTAHVNADRP